jgi:YegS/Rv2252/BmrU family lipid kinase
MSYHAFVIVNPASANGATGRHWPELRAAIDKVLDRWDNQFTLTPGDATRLARQATKDGYQMIVAVGGDGTMNEVVTGLFEEAGGGKLIRDDLILAPIRAGTGGDFARLLQLPHKLPASVAHLAGGATRLCDLGRIDYIAHGGAPAWRGFLNIASFGLSGLVDEKVNSTTKMFGAKGSFLAGTFRALAAYRPQSVEIDVGGENVYRGPLIVGAVANGQFFGGGMQFCPRAEIDDGQFDVVWMVSVGVKEVASILDLYSGRAIEWRSMRSTRGRTVEARPSDPSARVLIDVDGEQPGHLPATFRILPSAVRLKVAG